MYVYAYYDICRSEGAKRAREERETAAEKKSNYTRARTACTDFDARPYSRGWQSALLLLLCLYEHICTTRFSRQNPVGPGGTGRLINTMHARVCTALLHAGRADDDVLLGEKVSRFGDVPTF